MPKRPEYLESLEKLERILEEEDPFRLAIRGHAAVEAALDDAIASAFGGSTPRELRRLPFRLRLALAEALGMRSDSGSGVIKALASLRHDFAHGKIHDLTPARAANLLEEIRRSGVQEVVEMLDTDPPREPLQILGAVVVFAHTAVAAAAFAAQSMREQQERAAEFGSGVLLLLHESGLLRLGDD